ncbi:MAG: LCP family protein [Clostridia bacterium]|nr:LCP family protein [Clostridia bacterium]
MIQGKSVILYIGGLAAALALVLFGAWHFLFHNIESDESMQNLMDSQTVSGSGEAAGYDCVALLGIDTDEGDAGRSDAILLASIDRKQNKIRLCSVARDTRVEIDGYGKRKLNAAYAYGGGELTLQTLNENFGLQVGSYVAVNFSGMAEIVDALGGVDVELSEGELEYLGSTGAGLSAGDSVHLNGSQAVAYSRIRYLDNDDVRTSRQREVLTGLLDQIRQLDEEECLDLMGKLLDQCTTNLSRGQLAALLAQLTPADTEISQYAIPSNQTQAEGQTIDGAWYYVYDTQKAGEEIRSFLEIEG